MVTGRPQRIQLRRTKGWRLPAGAVSVARPTRWGNPYRMSPYVGAEKVVRDFERELRSTLLHPWAESHPLEFRIMAESIGELRGHDLACWCPLDQPCHADVLLEVANR